MNGDNAKKTMQLISKTRISLWVAMAAMVSADARGETFRTDINPALLCYQAIILRPDLSTADRDYLLTNEWRGERLDARFGALASQFDNEFKLLSRAAQAKVPCDWGIDLSPGPDTLLPQLGKVKMAAQIARLRALWDLQNGKQNEGRDDLLAAFTLARNTSRDGTLIGCLVQIAMESIICSSVAENYTKFSPQTLVDVLAGFESAPPRRTVADCIGVERAMFMDGWLIPKIQAIQQANPGNEPAAWHAVLLMFDRMTDADNPVQTVNLEGFAKAAGGTSDGVLKLARELGPFYDRFATVLALPYADFDGSMNQVAADIQKSTNPLVHLFLPAIEKCRGREFVILTKLAMVRAAVEYKLHGNDGLKSVADPCGNGPFTFEPFVLDGARRGFKLTSAYAGPGSNALIFVEKEGAPFHIDGKDIGLPIQK